MVSINKVKLFFAFILACEFALKSDAIIAPSAACGDFEVTCPDKSCIAKNLLCNGFHDCSDGADEINCPPYCQPNEFLCNNKRCVPKLRRCDSKDDCGDNSDEMNCSLGSKCKDHQFRCTFLKQCIPKSFRCDRYADCADGSDEHDCFTEGITTTRSPFEIPPPPPIVFLPPGGTFDIACTANGKSLRNIVWILNYRPIPKKCKITNEDGVSKFTCPDVQQEDAGIYTCEGGHIKGSLFQTDTILIVSKCRNGFFNQETHKCISCFCSNVSYECSSANLYKYRLKPSFGSYKVIQVKKDTYKAVFHIRNEIKSKGSQPRVTASGGVNSQFDLDHIAYLAMPRNFLGNQLQSYGGYLRYRLIITNYRSNRRAGRTYAPFIFPDVILMGKDITLLYFGNWHEPKLPEEISIGLIEGKWLKQDEQGQNRLATRDEILMALTSVQDILIRTQYIHGYLDTMIDNIDMDSARNISNFKDLDRTSYVEECRCPRGYQGLSCEDYVP